MDAFESHRDGVMGLFETFLLDMINQLGTVLIILSPLDMVGGLVLPRHF